MVTKLRKINPINYRVGFCFFWNKAFNNSINKFNKFLKFVYLYTYFFTILFEKFFNFKVYKLNFFFKNYKLLFNFNIYSFNLIYFSIFNLYFPKLYNTRLNIFNIKCIFQKENLLEFIKLYKLKKYNFFFKNKILVLLIQGLKNINLKVSNNKIFNFFLNEFLSRILKKKLNILLFDTFELIENKNFLKNFISKNLQLHTKLRLKIKSSVFYFLIITAWISLLQKNSYFFTKLLTFGLKTRSQKIFLRFIRKFLMTFFNKEVKKLKLKTPNFLKGIQIGLFGKIFGRRRSKKLYLKYNIKKTQLSSLNFKNINFTFLKSWTYYGVFGVKVWFFY